MGGFAIGSPAPSPAYSHRQKAPLALMLYVIAAIFVAIGFAQLPRPLAIVFPTAGLIVALLAACFHHLTIEDQGDRLAVHFGPIPLFRRTVRYEEIARVETGQTTWVEGWGVHLSHRGGWVWNIWGWDCVVLHFERGVLRLGTDEPERLASFLREKTGSAAATAKSSS